MIIDLDALDKFMDENPWHMSPEEQLEALFDDLPGGDRRLIEATHILGSWERAAWIGNPVPFEQRKAEADFFFLKWNFVGGNNRNTTRQ
jgi:hypothetical protein